MVRIRPATLDDVDSVHALGSQVPEFSVNPQTVNFWPRETLQRSVESDDVLIFIASDKGTTVGFILASYNRSLRKAIVENIFTASSARGQGVGKRLLEHLLQHLSGNGCEYIAALVPPQATTATELYLRAGFTKGEHFLWLDKALSDTFKN